jgi:hypothetical protein
MKIRLSLALIFLIALLSITGCKAAETQTTDMSMESAYPGDKGYPADAVYPTEDYANTSMDEAYPIKEQDLDLLYRTWTLSTVKVNDQEQTPPMKTLAFQADGTVLMTDENGTTEGHWFAVITMYPTLTLELSSENTLTYHLVSLTKANLDLQLMQNNDIIDEQYQPEG